MVRGIKGKGQGLSQDPSSLLHRQFHEKLHFRQAIIPMKDICSFCSYLYGLINIYFLNKPSSKT